MQSVRTAVVAASLLCAAWPIRAEVFAVAQSSDGARVMLSNKTSGFDVVGVPGGVSPTLLRAVNVLLRRQLMLTNGSQGTDEVIVRRRSAWIASNRGSRAEKTERWNLPRG